MEINKKSNIAILVVSCDNYSDLWEPFFQCFKRFWKDCHYKVYLLSNYKDYNSPDVETIKVGEDRSWSDNLINALKKMDEDYVFMFLEDLFLYKPVDNEQVIDLFNWAVGEDVNYLRTTLRFHRADKPYNEKVGVLKKGSLYRASTVMALWKKSVLLDLLEPGETAWQFEIGGTERSNKYDKFFATYENYFHTLNTVVRGKWVPSALKKVKAMGIEIDLAKREVMTFFEYFKLLFMELRSYILSLLPKKWRKKIRNFLIK